jgi:hypothetical protein
VPPQKQQVKIISNDLVMLCLVFIAIPQASSAVEGVWQNDVYSLAT